MTLSKRDFLALGAAAVGLGAVGGGAFAVWPRPKLVFQAVKNPPGFRRIATQSAGISAFTTGLDNTGAAALSKSHLCRVTFGNQQAPGRLVIASFSDFFCPYCRILDEQVHAIVARDPKITLISHQVPLLGRASDFAARGGIAAEKAGVYDAYFKRLIRTTFVPNPAYLRDFARSQGIDPDQFIAELDSTETETKLAESRAAFRAFGFVGTPGLVVGRTLVNGVIAPRDLRALVAEELTVAGPINCA